ncbi:MAG: hypothetical protein PHG34_06550, partial [Candidatus Cloacimonetes bacterium]|nr:hypothetical protein [Candidatus Cloacimonadota bacterium]MDY0326227.1 hypothetical protein [Candidatus Cloacimonadaceae bacterium]
WIRYARVLDSIRLVSNKAEGLDKRGVNLEKRGVGFKKGSRFRALQTGMSAIVHFSASASAGA